MAKKPVRIMRRVVPPAQRARALRGATLFQPVTAAQQYSADVVRAFEQMRREVEREVLQAYTHHDSPALQDGGTMDAASLPAIMARLLAKLKERFQLQFNQLAKTAVKTMVDRTVQSSTSGMRASLKDIAPDLTLKMDTVPQAMKDVIAAGSQQAAGYIKMVPQKYLEAIGGDVMRSITTGRGLADLQPALEKQGVEVKNWARNVSLDQTRKVYNTVNKERMRSLGVRKFEWVHSGGSQHPREYHKYTLNGNIYEIDNPPIIDERTGERGYPGQLPYCRCTMRPVIDFDDEG